MGLVVGSARIDEYGRISGGKVGDQTGKEVSTQAYYMHSKGWYCLRPKSVEHANGIAAAMLRACNNNNIGYDQGNRLGVIKYGTRSTVKTECDCSSLVRQCIKEATGKDVGNFTTWNEADTLEKSGLFYDRISVTSSTVLYSGDVLITKKKGHTVVVCTGRARSGGNAPASTPSQSSGKLTIDGSWGQATTRATQKFLGTYVDGIVSNQPSSNKGYLPNADKSSWEFKSWKYSGGSSMVKALQRLIGTTADGYFGKNSVKALQKYLNKYGYGLAVDGSMGGNTVRAWQKFLNSKM